MFVQLRKALINEVKKLIFKLFTIRIILQFDNGYNSPLTLPIIKEKIESVLHFASLPLVEDGTLESLLYQTWFGLLSIPILF